ncbi:MAG: hypothetical protein ACOC8F_02470 [Planctomycetota bacterium]
MRAKPVGFVAAIMVAAAVCGCDEQTAGEPTPPPGKPHPAVLEARTDFTYEGKPIPPFFLADFNGGPEAPDFWLRDAGSRVCAIAVEGLFVDGDGAYTGVSGEVTRSGDGMVRFDLPQADGSCDFPCGYMGYKFVGTTPSGITVLQTIVNTGGSGTIPGVMFVRFEMASAGATRQTKRARLTMHCLGEMAWGDRVYRDVTLEGNTLRLGPERTSIPACRDTLEGERRITLE